MYVHSCISMTFGKILMYIIFPSNIYRILRTMQSRVVYGMCTCRFSQQPTVSDDLTTSWSNGSPIALASSKNQPRVGAAQVWNALRFWIARVAWQLAGFCAPTGNTSAKPFFLLGKKKMAATQREDCCLGADRCGIDRSFSFSLHCKHLGCLFQFFLMRCVVERFEK